MAKYVAIFILFFLLSSCSYKTYRYPTVEIKTPFGNIDAELYADKSPKSVAAFLSYVDGGIYKNSSFYRVLKEENQPSSAFKTELIQGGIWASGNKNTIVLQGIPHESTLQSGLHHTDGTLSLARTAPGTATSEFFICVGNQPAYDYGKGANPDRQGYAAFGRVIKGMDVVRRIHKQPDNGEDFDPYIRIINIVRK